METPSTRLRVVFWIIRTVVFCLKIIGLAPFSVVIKTSRINSGQVRMINFQFSKIGLVYQLSFLTLCTLMIMFTFEDWIYSRLANDHLVAQIMYKMCLVTSPIAAIIIIISWTVRQKSAVCIGNRLLEVGFQISRLNEQLTNKKTIIFLTLHGIINAVIWIALWINVNGPPEDLHKYVYQCWDLLSSHVMYWFTMEYVVVVSLIARGLKTMNKNLMNLGESCSSVPCSQSVSDFLQAFSSQTESSQLAALRSLIVIRMKLSDIAQDVGSFFSLPILCCIVYTFFGLVLPSYRFIVVPDSSRIYLTPILVSASFHIYPIVSLSANVTEAVKQAKLTAQIVCKAIASAPEGEIKAELEQFSLDLLRDDFTFTACGFFTLDFTLVLSMIGTITSYIVISLQFVTSKNDYNKNDTLVQQ